MLWGSWRRAHPFRPFPINERDTAQKIPWQGRGAGRHPRPDLLTSSIGATRPTSWSCPRSVQGARPPPLIKGYQDAAAAAHERLAVQDRRRSGDRRPSVSHGPRKPPAAQRRCPGPGLCSAARRLAIEARATPRDTSGDGSGSFLRLRVGPHRRGQPALRRVRRSRRCRRRGRIVLGEIARVDCDLELAGVVDLEPDFLVVGDGDEASPRARRALGAAQAPAGLRRWAIDVPEQAMFEVVPGRASPVPRRGLGRARIACPPCGTRAPPGASRRAAGSEATGVERRVGDVGSRRHTAGSRAESHGHPRALGAPQTRARRSVDDPGAVAGPQPVGGVWGLELDAREDHSLPPTRRSARAEGGRSRTRIWPKNVCGRPRTTASAPREADRVALRIARFRDASAGGSRRVRSRRRASRACRSLGELAEPGRARRVGGFAGMRRVCHRWERHAKRGTTSERKARKDSSTIHHARTMRSSVTYGGAMDVREFWSVIARADSRQHFTSRMFSRLPAVLQRNARRSHSRCPRDHRSQPGRDGPGYRSDWAEAIERLSADSPSPASPARRAPGRPRRRAAAELGGSRAWGCTGRRGLPGRR